MKLLDAMKSPAARVPRPRPAEVALLELVDPEMVTIPLEYPERLVLRPSVQVGEKVARYQPIGRSELGNCVHASIGGTVREIRPVWTASGHHVPAVVIERGNVPDLTPDETLTRCGLDVPSATRLQLLKAAGVIAPWTTPRRNHSGGSGTVAPEIVQVIIVGHDEEPTEHVQEILLQERAQELADSLRLLSDLAPQASFTLTVPHRLTSWAREVFPEGLRVVGVVDEYRRRLVRVLVRELTGVSVPATEPYRLHGLAVMTVESATTAQDALRGRPFVRKTLTVSGATASRSVTVRTALGASAEWVLAACGLDTHNAGRILANGPMRGMALFTDETPVDKFQHGIHLLSAHELPTGVNFNCVNCGRCVRACPARLQVHLIGRYVEFDLPARAGELHPEACHDCGLCAFVCPAHRPLVQLMSLAKAYRRETA